MRHIEDGGLIGRSSCGLCPSHKRHTKEHMQRKKKTDEHTMKHDILKVLSSVILVHTDAE